MSRKINKDKLNAKLAAFLNMPVEEVAAKQEQLYSFEESVFEAQSVLNFYEARIKPRQRAKETDAEFEARQQEWRFKTCESCMLEFAYAYSYEGVKFCSLDCLDTALKKIGLRVTYGKDLRKRWGVLYPAIVPSSALQSLRQIHGDSSFAFSETPSALDA